MDDVTLDEDLNDSGKNELSPSMIEDLKVSNMWMRTVGVLQMIFIALAGFGILALLYSTPIARRMMGNQLFIIILVLIGGFILALTLYKAGKSFKDFQQTGKKEDLEKSFLKGKQFWTASGIISILAMVFYVFTFLSDLGRGF